jgi:hypothetical protein
MESGFFVLHCLQLETLGSDILTPFFVKASEIELPMSCEVRKLMARKFSNRNFLAINFLTFSCLGSIDFLWIQDV